MLVLTRKKHESILIGENIRITIFCPLGQRIQVGIEAPRDLCVIREEIADKPPKTKRAT